MKTYFLIAGEASGDLHASRLREAIKRHEPEARFVGLGGDKMRNAGCELVQDYREMAFMGVLAVLKNLGKVKRNFEIAKTSILTEKPDVLILIDYPSFNLKMAQFAREQLPGIKIVYYIPPKVWAWKTFRIHKIAKLCDEVLGIFPMETAFFARYGYKCRYVGNPTMDSVGEWLKSHPQGQRDDKLIALLPGSRKGEISHCLKKMLAAARAMKGYKIVVAAAPGVEDSFYTGYLKDGEQLTRETYALVSKARAAIVNSGTATLETALLGCPQQAVYHIAMSKVLGFLRPLLFKIPHFTLVNIILGREVIQEQVSYRYTERIIHDELKRLLEDEPYRTQMLDSYQELKQVLGNTSAATTAAEVISNL